MKKIFSFILCFFLLQISFSQTRDKSASKIADLEKQLDSIFAKVSKNDPGCAITIIENNEVLLRRSYGMANIENQVPLKHQSVLRLPYSEAREFISIAAVLMEKDGILSLNDKVNKYFPELPDWSETVTIWDLLNHRSGFVDEWATLLLMYNSMSNRFEKEQFLRLLCNQPIPEVEPGKEYMYSNSDFGLLRLIMEKASGQDLSDWIKQRILEPLKMKNTEMQKDPLDIIPNRADLYEEAPGGGYKHAQVQKTSPGGNYYILTSASDLEIWAAANNNPNSEISQAVVKLMANVRQIPGKESHYVFGYTLRSVSNHEVILHEGVNGFNYLTRVPSKGITVITLGNRHGNGFAEENESIINYFLKQAPPSLPKLITQPISLPESELSKYTGNFLWQNQVSWEGPNQIRKFSTLFVDEGKLKIRYTGNYVIELTPVGKDIFYYKEGKDGFGVQFEFKKSSPDAAFILTVTFDDGFPGVTMAQDSGVIWKPSKEILAEFTGRFYSKHLDYYWNLDLNEAGKLILKSTNLPDIELEPDGYNQFHCIGEKYPGSGYDRWILFEKNAEGAIINLIVWSGRVMHHRFDKQ